MLSISAWIQILAIIIFATVVIVPVVSCPEEPTPLPNLNFPETIIEAFWGYPPVDSSVSYSASDAESLLTL